MSGTGAATRERAPGKPGVPRFDPRLCKQCGICAHVCPSGVLEPPARSTPTLTEPEACNGCRTCEYTCPDFAIHLVRVL